MNLINAFSLACLMSLSFSSVAASITLTTLDTEQREGNYYVDATFELDFGDEIQEALKHGIPVHINTDLEVKMIRDWIPDKTIKSINLVYQLLHQPLTEDYLTIDLKTGLRHSYNSLSAALYNIGQISGINLVNSHTLSEEHQYRGRIRMYLDLDSLPTPMRPQVYFSKNWAIASDWQEWTIKE